MDLITDLLKSSLLETLGDDAGRAEKLRAAAAALGSRLAGDDRALTPRAVLAAATPGNGNASVLDLAYEILLDEWDTLANAFPERPVELLRAVLLGGVAEAAEAAAEVRLAGWYTLRSALEHGAGGRWTAQLGNLLREWHGGVEEQIKERWQPAPASSALRMPSLSEPQAFTMKSRDALINRAQALQAAGNWQAFYNDLQPTCVQDVTRLIQLAEGAGLAGGKSAVNEVKKGFGELGAKLREAFELHERGLETIRLRGELLWWQQSCYSPILELGYGELDGAADVVVAAALDLHALVPDVAPVAAEHVLAALVGSLTAGTGVSITELRNASAAVRLPSSSVKATPATLLAAITPGDQATGVPALQITGALQPDRAAVLLFRDLQAAAVVASESE